MNPFCPNLSNPEVKKEFDELVDVFGENRAYYLWDKNQGYSIDKAPNGEPSKLFQSHLEAFNGDRVKALKATKDSLANGISHSEPQYQLGVTTKNPIEGISDTIGKIGLNNLVQTLVDAGLDEGIAKSIHKAVKRNSDLRNLKPIDVFNILLKERDVSLRNEYNKRVLAPLNEKLEQHLISIIRRYLVDIKDLSELHTDDESLDLERITGAFDIFNKIIYLSQNRNSITLPEEFSHAFIRLMGIVGKYNPQLKEIYDLIQNTSLYKQVYEEYKNVYGTWSGAHKDYWKTDEHKIKEEAVGQALAAIITGKWEYDDSISVDRNLFQKIKDFVFNILDKIKYNYEKLNQKLLPNEDDVKRSKSATINDTDDRNVVRLIERYADEILNDHITSLDKLDDTGYNLLDFSETIHQQNEKDGGIALRFMRDIVSLGGIITGSLSYRKQGTVYRAAIDSLHDIDVQVPGNVHNVFPGSFWHLELHEKYKQLRAPLWNEVKGVPKDQISEDWKNRMREIGIMEREDYLKAIEGNQFFDAIKKKYPDIKFTAFYIDNHNWAQGFTVSAIWSTDNALSERFDKLTGSYKERLNQFTEEEQDKMYLFDFFLVLQPEIQSVHDDEFDLELTEFQESFRAKALMGREKDVYDYQRWQLFNNYKNAYAPRTEGLLLQQQPLSVQRVVDQKNRIRLSLPSHTKQRPRELVLEPQGNKKYYIHTRTWDGEKIAAQLTDVEKSALYDALYDELPEGAEILVPKSGDGYYLTRGAIANLIRLSRDDRFEKGQPGIVEYQDKDGKIKQFETTSFIKRGETYYEDVQDEIDVYTNADEYIVAKLSEYSNEHPSLTDDEINIKRREFLNDYVQKRQREIMDDTAIKIANAFGLIKQADGSWMSDGADEFSRLRVEFVNSIDSEHSGMYEHNSMSVSAHHVIRIGIDKADPTTFNHEMAHHYLRMFWNSSVVQEALKAVDKPGMTDREREEALVDKIVEISYDNVYGNVFENNNFFHTFWNKFANMLYNVFDIQTATVRNQLMQNVTRAFLLNEQLSINEDERQLFNFVNSPVYQSARSKYKSRKQSAKTEPTYRASTMSKQEELTEAIIKHTENKDKAYSRRGGINEQQVIKLQQAVYAVRQSANRIKDAIAANRVADAFHEKAELILDYMDRAIVEIGQSVNAFNSAMSNNYKEFVYSMNPDGTVVYSPQGNSRKKITFDDLVNIKSDILSFHANLIGSIGKMLNDTQAQKGFSTDDIDRIRDKYNSLRLSEMISKFQNTFNAALDKACIRDIIDYIDKNVPLEEDMKTRLKINMLKWLRDQNDFGEVSIYEQWIGVGSHSKSPIIRMMQDIINDLQYEVAKPSEEVGQDINSLLKKARISTTKGFIGVSKYNIKIGKFNIPTPWNIQKLLMEIGEDGLPTGNFISKINRGNYERRKEDFLAELLFGKDGNGGLEKELHDLTINGQHPYANFEIQLDKYGVPIFPEDDAIEPIAKKYYEQLEDWRCKNEDRQFTEAYYKERIRHLSVKTLAALNKIQSQVSEIYSACTVRGVVRTDLLSSKQKQDLEDLRLQKAQLYNFYNEDGTMKADGTVEKQIAVELAKWSMFTKDKVKYKIDYDAFNEALNLAKNKQSFYDENTQWVINPKVWEWYNRVCTQSIPNNTSDPEIELLNKLIYQRTKMLSSIKSNGFGFPNMSSIWDEQTGTLKNRDFWVNLQKLETSIQTLRRKLKDKYRTQSRTTRKQNFGKVFNTMYNPVNPNGPWFGNNVLRQLDHMRKRMRVSSPQDIQLLYIKGTSEPLSIFSTLIPTFKIEQRLENGRMVDVQVQTNDRNETYEIFVRVPNSNFSVIDKDASDNRWVNKNFVSDNGKTYSPKESVYKNDRFSIIENNPALKALYDKLINTTRESWEKIPFLGDYDLRLPQMRAATHQVLGRRRNIFKSIGYQLSSWWEINETDEWMNDDYQTRPDGSRIDFIPIRFIKRLERPEYISSDVCGSVIQFFEMAQNYKIKAAHVARFEAYLDKFQDNDLETKQSWNNVSQSKILSHMIDVQMYGREQTLSTNSKKVRDRHRDQKVKNWLKRVRMSRGWAQASLLAFNFSSAIVSALDPMISLTLDMITGKYTNYKDFFYAIGVLASDMPRAGASLGSVTTYSKANAGMQFFQLSKNVSSTYRNMDRSQFMRFVTDGLPMKVFTIGDYTINCITMVSTMNNYKLYTYKDHTDQHPHMKFLKKEEFMREAISDGRTQDEAEDMYNGWSKITLWDAFELKDGKFQVIDKYKNIIDDVTMKNVRKQVQSRSSIYNGIVPDLEKTQMQTNIWTAFITMLRNFLIMGINERFKNQRDFQVADYEQYQQMGVSIEDIDLINATPESIMRAKKDQSKLKGGWNFSTRTIEDGVFTGFADAIRKMSGYAKYYLGWVARTADENKDIKDNIYQLSDFDKYAAKKVSLELLTAAMLLPLAVFLNGKADEDPDDYWLQLLALVFTRLPSERFTFYSPTLVSDLITSPTSAMSAFRRWLRIIDFAVDLTGINGNNIEDPVVYGTYAGQARWFRDVCGMLSGYGLHNLYTNTQAKSLREKNKFYKKLIPMNLGNIDAILETFGIDLAPNALNYSGGNSSFGNDFNSSFGNNFSGGFK